MQYLIVLVVLAVAFYVISAPLRAARQPRARDGADGADSVTELEAARDAKYREIRDAELDVRTGKLSEADYHAVDGTLRAEAIEILRGLDAAQERSGADAPTPPPHTS